jgi:hypothetical protein
MRLVLIAAAALVAAPATAQDARPPAYIIAETCLHDNADAAVRAGAGAADAADFLLTYLCAGPVTAAGNYQRNTVYLAAMQQMTRGATAMVSPGPTSGSDPGPANGAVDQNLDGMFGLFDGAGIDPVTGEFIADPSNSTAMGAAFGLQLGTAAMASADQRPVFLRELAGRLVLQRRR